MKLLRIVLMCAMPFAVTALSAAQATFSDKCPSGAPLPFAAIEVKHPIDSSCGLQGKPTSPDTSHTQNLVKNNFCSTATPETFTPQMLIALQNNNHIASGKGLEPADRSQLKSLGEGKVVRMKAFLIEAHHADLGGGESVNCNGAVEEQNDIHIAFGPAVSTKECASVSAEISPHFRPASWNEIGHFETWDPKTQTYTGNPGMASRLQAHAYRVTGQTFFDASHAPCPCSTSCSPVRASVWEIHPVYNIEVCKAGAACDENNDADWIAFDTWWKSLAPLQPVKGRHSHKPHETTTTSGHGHKTTTSGSQKKTPS
jgi:hypothetical protein